MNKELAYLLGFFYADGYASKKTKYRKTTKDFIDHYSVGIEILTSDSESIKYCLDKVGIIYTSSKRFRKNSPREQTAFRISAKEPLRDLFIHTCQNKNNPKKALEVISIEYHPYFLRGFFDGDGCISVSKRNKARMYFYGTYDFIWNPIFDIFQTLDIHYIYQQIVRKQSKHKSSHVFISNKFGIIKLFEYIYPDRIFDFGLYRKFEKLKLTIEATTIVREIRKKDQKAKTLKVFS